ncbi:MAG: hypothetical protein CMP16_03240 [Rickettsiales bacterium]|nr:hypothetical protein [Rickettsiales bacterium]
MNRFLIIIILFNLNNLFAQSNEGEIEDAQILIEKNSSIILPKVDKSIKKIDLENINIEKKIFEFENIIFKPIKSNKKIDKILRDETSYDLERDIFIDLKLGNYSTFILNTNPYYKSGNKFALYSDIFVKLNSKGSKLSNVSGEEINDINLYADYKYNINSRLSSHLNFSSYSNGYYGFINDENIILTDDLINNLRFSNNSFKYKFDWENIGKQSNSNINYSGKIFQNSFHNETQHIISSNVTIPLSNTLVSFIPKFDFYELDQRNSQNIISKNKLSFTQVDLPFIFDFTFSNLNIRINTSYQFLSRNFKNTSNKSSFSPGIKFKYYNKNLTLNLSASRGYYYSKYSNILNGMPFIYDVNIINQFYLNREFYRVKFGLDVNLFKNSYLSLSYESVKQQGSLDYRPYIGENLPSDIKVPMYLYTLKRNNDKEIINYLSLSFNGSFTDNFKSSINYLYTIYENDDVFQPLYVFDIVNTYYKNNISLSIGGNFELENYGMDFNSNLIKMKSFIDIYFNSTYSLSKNIELNLNVNNILNRYNERFFMYPELGINFVGGIKWVF